MHNTITGSTKLTGLLGRPVTHSISPLMHNLAFNTLNLDYVYLCFDTTQETLKSVVDGLKAINISGFNCTMPAKNKMYELVDELSPEASIIKAVNTVKNVDGRLIGYNTDGYGFMQSALDAGYTMAGEKLTLFGTGGAASSICVQAALDGVRELDIYGRKTGVYWKRTEELIKDLHQKTSCKVNLYEYADDSQLRKSISESKFLTNATSLGMSPELDGCILKDDTYFHDDLVVSDIIYEPRKTKLLQMAERKGCSTFNGLYMLLYQGAKAFEIWTGEKMPVNKIKDAYFN
jgi:shikimate dehydrogenase